MKIDAKFFKINGSEDKGNLIFQVSDLDWTADFMNGINWVSIKNKLYL